MSNFAKVTMNLVGAQKRYETLNGKTYMVVPTVMITEGVWQGNQGPLLYLGEELGKNPVTWNHVLAYPGTFSWLEGIITGNSAGLGWYYAKYSANSIGVDSFTYPRCPTAGPAGSAAIMDVLTKPF